MGSDDYFVTGRPSLAGRRAGGSAREKAREITSRNPVRTRIGRVLGVHTDERAWRRGAEGEERLGKTLGRLPGEWHVFHDVPLGERGANIDHLVVGPGGVFTVNTKNLAGKVWVGSRVLLLNGHKTDFLPRAVHEAREASLRMTRATGLPVSATPLLALYCEGFTAKTEPEDVHVMPAGRVKAWLLQRAPVLSTADRDAIARAADNPATWR